MTDRAEKPRVLIFSLRNIFGKALNRGPHYEFEDIICDIDSADLIAPTLDPASRRAALATRLAYHAPLTLNPGLSMPPVQGSYDLLFTICGFPQDLLMFNAVDHLRDHCKTSVCLLDELWARDIHKHRHFLPILAKFDIVLQYHSQTVQPLSELIGPRCRYFAPGVDASLFCPYPDPPARPIDVYSMGRRPEAVHQKLVAMARDNGLFYLHDTISGSQAIDTREHRAQVANLAKRSRYFLVNPGKFDRPEETGNQVEFGYRYFEGAASGAIMLGERPNNEVFPDLFDWPDAVIDLPHQSSEVDRLISELDRDPERQDRIRRTGIAQSLMRHDWAYRWEAILCAAGGLQPMPGLAARKHRLKTLADMTMADGAPVWREKRQRGRAGI
ncbi:glycosyltransferase family protein [Bradyrhizobium sp. HKCCYLS2038]|uniref:glycosyltransferase n=1 Tax=unclassified Bradyrhizobium TaxID=2631580 RepID=UPI003EBF63D7